MKKSIVVPVLFGYFIMGFCDIAGVATNFVRSDFGLSETVAGLIPAAIFVWFLLLGIPISALMNRVGRKMTVQIGNAVTFAGMLLPALYYDFAICMAAFAMLGIGNTMLQVALNPLLGDAAGGRSLASMLTAGQVVKAVSSFCGPFIAAAATVRFGHWQYIFPVYAVLTLLSAVWLARTEIAETRAAGAAGGVRDVLSDGVVRSCFIGIIAVVGLDVGLNVVTPKLLAERCVADVAQAGLGASVYFLCRTCGTFVGAFALARVSGMRYFRWNISAAAAALLALFFVRERLPILAAVGAAGFFAASVFSILFAAALRAVPERSNEVSGLMITGCCGGALCSLAMGVAADSVGSQNGSLAVLMICLLYLVCCAFALGRGRKEDNI